MFIILVCLGVIIEVWCDGSVEIAFQSMQWQAATAYDSCRLCLGRQLWCESS